MHMEANRTDPLLGTFELDAEGVVLHFSPASVDKGEISRAPIGADFFDHISFVTKNEDLSEEVRNRFFRFMASDAPVERFAVNYRSSQAAVVTIQVMMASLTEKTAKGTERLAVIKLASELRAAAPLGDRKS